jgi:hypothetical protein
MARTKGQLISPIGILTASEVKVTGNVNVTGIITAGSFSGIRTDVYTLGVGTVAHLRSTNINATGIITANNVVVGAAQTTLIVQGDARITGILTIGTGSITLNGSTNNITGIASITDSSNRKLVALNTGGTNVTMWHQATSPVGWTKVTTHNNKSLRVVSGTGGGSGGTSVFTSVFASRTPAGSVSVSGSNSGGGVSNTTAGGSVSGSNSGGSVSDTTLATSQIPSHQHSYSQWNTANGTAAGSGRAGALTGSDNTGNTGGGGAHGHGFTNPSWSGSFTGSSHGHSYTNASWSGSGSFSGSAMDFDVQYIDMILCSFD